MKLNDLQERIIDESFKDGASAPSGAHSRRRAPGANPVSNTGGKSEIVRYGERVYSVPVYKAGTDKIISWKIMTQPLPEGKEKDAAIIDTLTFTVREDDCDFLIGITDEDIAIIFGMKLSNLIGITVDSTKNGQRKNNYLQNYTLIYANGETGKNLGFLGVGGNHGTVCIHLTGEACNAISKKGFERLYEFFTQTNAKITRVDLAYDDYEGERNIETAIDYWQKGLFKNGGRPPKMSQVGNFIQPDGSGRTIYIGSRQSGKMARIYEKGKQLGDVTSDWVRWEVEIKSEKRKIPHDIIIRSGEYLAGMYPALGWIEEIQDVIETISKTVQINYVSLIASAKKAYGRLIYVMREMGNTAEQIIKQLERTDGLPSRLIMPIPQVN